jgi:N-acetylmuramoyl-L-alanine amidase
MQRRWRRIAVWSLALVAMALTSSVMAAPVPPEIEQAVRSLLHDQGLPAIHSVDLQDDALTVCLAVDAVALATDGWLGVESLVDTVRAALISVEWRDLSVQAVGAGTGECRPLSDYAPGAVESDHRPASTELMPQRAGNAGVRGALAGKTVYISAGHGWFWNGSTWRTQRPVYQGFIEDHNNAEAVAQYLIPYLENAGATVIPVRERDWAEARVIADNDAGAPVYAEWGAWATGGSGTGYDGGTYRYAVTNATGSLTARATWTMQVPVAGRYAVYAWVFPGSNRVRDAHYTIHHAGGPTEVVLDQSIYPQTWRYLGTFPFYTGSATVTLDNRSSDPTVRAVIADAIRLGSGSFDTLAGLPLLSGATTYASSTPPSRAPNKPWWETSTFYWSQWMGLNPAQWPYFNDVVGRPMMARWYQRATGDDAVFISWHTNGSNGTARGTVTYVHNGETFPRTTGSKELQDAIHTELVADIRAGWDPTWRDLGQRSLNLGEMRMLHDPEVSWASLPGVLLEIAFHDNPEDAAALKEPVFNQLAARAVAQGIVKYFERRDGVTLTRAPEPPVDLRVENEGSGSVRVSWAPAPADGVGGDAATAYRVVTSPDGFAWGPPVEVAGTSALLSGLAEGQTTYVRVVAANAGGESFPTEVMGARVGDARVLLVNGFDKLNRFELVREVDPVEGANLRMFLEQMNSRRYIVHHGQAMPAGVAWDSTSNEAVQKGYVRLLDYDIVIWMLGEESSSGDGSLNTAERSLLTTYLAAGRSLMVTGSEFGYDLAGQGRDPAFLQAQLRVAYVADNAGTTVARPVAGSAFAGLPDLRFDDPAEYVVGYPDVFSPLGGARTALTYVGATTPGAAAVQYAAGCQRLLVFGFPFETLRVAQRSPVMHAALNFLDGCRVETRIDVPGDGAGYRTSPTFSGTASGGGLTGVELQLVRGSDGATWTGSMWRSAAAWFPAYGTTAWSYGMSDLPEGAYTLQARAVGGVVDETPAGATFWIDWTPPLIPTVVTPTAAVLVTGPLTSLVWQAPPDLGSPLTFEVQLGDSVRRFSETSAVVPAGRGAHQWRVRAVDAAANEGAWSVWHAFEVHVEQLFLPLVLK